MTGWSKVLDSIRHAHAFGHWPLWRRFDTVNVCERCLRPPRRGTMIPATVSRP